MAAKRTTPGSRGLIQREKTAKARITAVTQPKKAKSVKSKSKKSNPTYIPRGSLGKIYEKTPQGKITEIQRQQQEGAAFAKLATSAVKALRKSRPTAAQRAAMNKKRVTPGSRGLIQQRKTAKRKTVSRSRKY